MSKYHRHKGICDKLNETYKAKNIAYNDSFGKGFSEYGILMSVIRLEDKFMRFKALAMGTENKVKDESIKDTLMDMANYCIMTLIEMDQDNAVKNV